MMQPLTPEADLRACRRYSAEFIELFTHGSLGVEYDKPDRVSTSSNHTPVTKSASSPAGVAHRFGPFTDDFATWALF